MAVFFYDTVTSGLKNRNKLKEFIPNLFMVEGRRLDSLSVIFCSDEYLLNMNKTHLNHDYYTDIITFDLSETKKGAITGELYISIDRIKENAQTQKVEYNTELHRVIFHGCLHLCGYIDKSKQDIVEIRGKEDFYLKEYLKR
jgi:probable rRNA maturation factor